MTARSIFAFALLGALSAGCGSAPPKPSPPKPAPPVVASKPKPKQPDPFDKPIPKPAPKCESMTEQCVADKMTQAKIADASSVVFTPPSGWTYAQESTTSVAQTSDEGPALALAAFTVAPDEAKDAKKLDHRRDTLLQALGERLGLKMPKTKVFWKKADKTLTVGSYAFSLYQIEGGARAQKKGPLLVFTSALNADVVLLGVGFVNDDDTTDADGKILAAIQSIAPAPAPTSDAASKDPFSEKKKP